jgi:hypothetical protein
VLYATIYCVETKGETAMKKMIICGIAAALVAGCSEKKEEIKVFEVPCEKVVAFEQGDMIVKCPIAESLTVIQSQTPTAQFVQGGDFNYADAVADAEHIYVNVIPAGSYEWASKTEYRIMVKEPNFEGDAMWAVAVVTE